MLRYKSNGTITYFNSLNKDDNNITSPEISSDENKGKKRICVKYHNSTTSYGLTTDTTASEYSPKLRYSGSDIYFGKLNRTTTETYLSTYISEVKSESYISFSYNSYYNKYILTDTSPLHSYDSNYCLSFTTTELIKLSVFSNESNTTMPCLGNYCIIKPENNILYYMSKTVSYYYGGYYINFGSIIGTNNPHLTASYKTSKLFSSYDSNIRITTNLGPASTHSTTTTGNVVSSYTYYDSSTSNSHIQTPAPKFILVDDDNPLYFTSTATFSNITSMLFRGYTAAFHVYTGYSRTYSHFITYMPTETTNKADGYFYSKLDLRFFDDSFNTYTNILTYILLPTYTSQTASYTNHIANNYISMYLSDVPEILDYSSSFYNTSRLEYTITKSDFIFTKRKNRTTTTSNPENTDITNSFIETLQIYNIYSRTSEEQYTTLTTETIYTAASYSYTYKSKKYCKSLVSGGYVTIATSSGVGVYSGTMNPKNLKSYIQCPNFSKMYIDNNTANNIFSNNIALTVDKSFITTFPGGQTYKITNGQFKGKTGFYIRHDFSEADSLIKTNINNSFIDDEDFRPFYMNQGVAYTSYTSVHNKFIVDKNNFLNNSIETCYVYGLYASKPSGSYSDSRQGSTTSKSSTTRSSASYRNEIFLHTAFCRETDEIYFTNTEYKNYYLTDIFSNTDTYTLSYITFNNTVFVYYTTSKNYSKYSTLISEAITSFYYTITNITESTTTSTFISKDKEKAMQENNFYDENYVFHQTAPYISISDNNNII